jgi:AAA domain
MRILSSYSIKGGVGKTVLSVDLAFAFQRCGKRTLLVDLDPQGAAAFCFRVSPCEKFRAKEDDLGEDRVTDSTSCLLTWRIGNSTSFSTEWKTGAVGFDFCWNLERAMSGLSWIVHPTSSESNIQPISSPVGSGSLDYLPGFHASCRIFGDLGPSVFSLTRSKCICC